MKLQQIGTKASQATLRRAEKKAIKEGFVFSNGRANMSAYSTEVFRKEMLK